MSQNPILWVALVIALSSAVIWIVQIVRSRRRGGEEQRGWWEGPWDEDDPDRKR